jgi:uncharacterized protein (TIGR02453 family)
MAISTQTFTGFRPEAIQFLADLAVNNDRTWFQARKADYERLLKEPLEALCVALADQFATRGIPFTSDPVRSPFRIYRDVRFSKDKSPYKTNISASFPYVDSSSERRSHADEGGNPGGYFHMGPGEVYIGGGMWHPPAATVAAFRKAVVDDPAAVRKLLDDPAFVREFDALSGDKLQRVPPGFPKDHPEAELLKHKDFTFGKRLADSDAFSPRLPEVIAGSFEVALPLVRFLGRL